MKYVWAVAAALAALSVGALPGECAMKITVENTSETKAVSAPVSMGAPFAKGGLVDVSKLGLSDGSGRAAAVQAQCVSRWVDGSARWVLLDFQADVAPGGVETFTLTTGSEARTPEDAVRVEETGDTVTLSNGVISFRAKVGEGAGVLSTADGKTKAKIVSVVEIGDGERTTSHVVIDSLEVYARGPMRAAVELEGRRVYSDGVEGPWSQRVELFAGSAWARVEDTFVYAHLPGTHAEPENPLALWQVEARIAGEDGNVEVAAAIDEAESDGLVVEKQSVAFWGVEKPYDFSRYDDGVNVGEDAVGIATGTAKSCAMLVGMPGDRHAGGKPMYGMRAYAQPRVYAESGALGDFAAVAAGRFDEVEEGMRQALGFWMWFQDNDPKGSFGRGAWHGLFDWGDWQSRYADREHRPTGWNYHEGRYGWDCNEMDTALTLWHMFFHTGRGEYYRAAEAMSRHVMDVDTIHVDYRGRQVPDYVWDHHHYDAPWEEGERLKGITTVGQGRRHNVQHWGNGVGDLRHTWNGGIVTYYYMTGNRRAYKCALLMADVQMERIWGEAAGEYAVSLWDLYYAWQMTGEERYVAELKQRLEAIKKLRLPDGSIAAHIDFQRGTAYPEVDGEQGAYLDLTLDYISNALIDYYADTKDASAREVLLGLAERNMADTPEGPADYQRTDAMRLLAWAYRETGQKRFLDRAAYHLSSLEAQAAEREPSTPDEWLKSTYGLLGPHDWDIRVVGPAIRMAPYVMKALGEAEKSAGD